MTEHEEYEKIYLEFEHCFKIITTFAENTVDQITNFKNETTERSAFCLFCKQIELAKSYSLLIQNRTSGGTDLILRSFLEIHIDLRILLKEPRHEETLALIWTKHTKKLFESSNRKDLTNDVEFLEETISSFQEKGTQKHNIQGRFSNADMSELYNTVYRQLSSHSHNMIGILWQKYCTDNYSPKKQPLTQWEYREQTIYLLTFSRYFLQSIEQIEKHLDLESSNQSDFIKAKIKSLTSSVSNISSSN